MDYNRFHTLVTPRWKKTNVRKKDLMSVRPLVCLPASGHQTLRTRSAANYRDRRSAPPTGNEGTEPTGTCWDGGMELRSTQQQSSQGGRKQSSTSGTHVQSQHGVIRSDTVKGEGPQRAPQALHHSFAFVKKANLFESGNNGANASIPSPLPIMW